MDFSKVEAFTSINYIGDSMAFGGKYLVTTAQSTYVNVADCPDDEWGVLVICELMNDDTPMFFPLESLDPNEWEIIE